MVTANLIQLWGQEAQQNLSSPKWNERKESLTSLLQIIDMSDSIPFDRTYGELFDNLKKIVKSDSNINVVSEAVKVVTGLAQCLKNDYAPYVSSIAVPLLEKFKDKKAILREPLTKCVEVLIELVGFDKFLPAFQEVWKKPNAEVKNQLNLVIAAGLKYYSTRNTPISSIKECLPTILKFVTDADPRVRDSALVALGAIERLIGREALSALIGPLRDDAAKMAKITTYTEQAAKEAEEVAKSRNVEQTSTPSSELDAENGENGTCSSGPSVSALDPFELLPETDVMKLLNSEFQSLLTSKKWSDRRDALEELNKLLQDHKRLNRDPKLYYDLVTDLKKILEKDSNVNVVALAAKALTGLASGLRGAFEPFISGIGAVPFLKFKEKKAVVRDALASFVDELVNWTKLELYGEYIDSALLSTNPTVKKEVCMFLLRTFLKHDSDTFSLSIIDQFKNSLFKNVSDSDGDVRAAAEKAIAALVRCVGKAFAVTKLLPSVTDDKIKTDNILKEYNGIKVSQNEPATGPIRKLYGAATKPKTVAKKPMGKPAAPSRPAQANTNAVHKAGPVAVAAPKTRGTSGPVAKKPRPAPVRPTVKSAPIRPSTRLTSQSTSSLTEVNKAASAVNVVKPSNLSTNNNIRKANTVTQITVRKPNPTGQSRTAAPLGVVAPKASSVSSRVVQLRRPVPRTVVPNPAISLPPSAPGAGSRIPRPANVFMIKARRDGSAIPMPKRFQ